MRHGLTYLSLILLAACSSQPKPIVKAPLTPIPSAPVDPPDSFVKKSVAAFLEGSEAPRASQYSFTRIDLDSDGRRDALVLFKTPYGYWCGMHGCTMLVLKAHNDRFTLVNAIQPIREPLYVADNGETNGWKDLVVRVSGRWDKAKDVKIAFNGRQYPDNPSDLPPAERFAFSELTPVFGR